jgi:hypothetical protein
MLDTGLPCFWRIADGLGYWLTLVRLRILDAVAGPLPKTPADRQRERNREWTERAFPKVDPLQAPRRAFPRADHRWPR